MFPVSTSGSETDLQSTLRSRRPTWPQLLSNTQVNQTPPPAQPKSPRSHLRHTRKPSKPEDDAGSPKGKIARLLPQLVAVVLVSCIVWAGVTAAVKVSKRGGTRATVWGLLEEEPQKVGLPSPHDDKYFTLVQAAIISQDSTYRRKAGPKSDYFVNALAIIGENDPPARTDIWQVFVRNATYIEEAVCHFESENMPAFNTKGVIRVPWMYDLEGPRSGSALMLQCPVPLRWEQYMGIGRGEGKEPVLSDMHVKITLKLEGSVHLFEVPSMTLIPYRPPPPTQVGMCMSPIFGHWNAPNLVDWREHHRLLGFGPVHWYARKENFVQFTSSYPDFSDGHDTFRHAPPLNPETYNTSLLATDGLYSDQVIYALDCMLRSRYLAPSKWLAFYDLDEYFLPDPMPETAKLRKAWVNGFLDGLPEYASVSLGRTHLSDDAHLELAKGHSNDHIHAKTGHIALPARISALHVIRQPQQNDWPGNHKHIHRVDAVEGTAVHAPTGLYSGFTYKRPIVPSTAKVVHIGKTVFHQGPYEYFSVTSAVQKFMDSVAEQKAKVLDYLRSKDVPMEGFQ